MEHYTVSQKKARGNREGRNRVAYGILADMNTLRIEKAVSRAERTEKVVTKEGASRTYRVGKNVAKMCCWLLYWEGRGKLAGSWVYKTSSEWFEETGLTESMVKTARRIAKAEGLWEEREHLRDDNRWTVAFRLNMWRLLQVANASEIASTERLLERAGRNGGKRERLKTELERLKGTWADLGMIDGPGTGAPLGAASQEPQDHAGAPPLYSQGSMANTAALQGTTCKGSEERGTDVPPKKVPDLSLPRQEPKQLKPKQTDDDYERMWNDLVEHYPHGEALATLAGIMAERNKTSSVSVRRVWRTLGERFIKWQGKLDLDEEAWTQGLWAAILAEKPSIGYARKAAQSHDRREGR